MERDAGSAPDDASTGNPDGAGGGPSIIGSYEAEEAFHSGTGTFASLLAGFSVVRALGSIGAVLLGSSLLLLGCGGEEFTPGSGGSAGTAAGNGGTACGGAGGTSAAGGTGGSDTCGCPGKPPCGIRIMAPTGAYCIDPHEVTEAAFDEFAEANLGELLDAGASCTSVMISPRAHRSERRAKVALPVCSTCTATCGSGSTVSMMPMAALRWLRLSEEASRRHPTTHAARSPAPA